MSGWVPAGLRFAIGCLVRLGLVQLGCAFIARTAAGKLWHLAIAPATLFAAYAVWSVLP